MSNFEKYLNSFIEYLTCELNYSTKTATTYQRILNTYNDFNIKNKYNFLNIDEKKANLYKATLIQSGKDNKTTSLHLSALRCFYNFLVEVKALSNNPFLNLKNPKVAKKLPNFLNESDTKKFNLDIDYNNDLLVRNTLIIDFLYATGLRVSELCSIKVSDLNLSNKTLKVMGKGNKERIVFYKACDEKLLNRYLTNNRNNILKTTSEYLFISESGKPLSTRTVELIVKKYAQTSDVKSKVTPHTLRHTYATGLLNNGADIRSVGELLGHESLSTTQIYTHVTSERLKKVYEMANPQKNLKK